MNTHQSFAKWYNRRSWAIFLAMAALGLTYLVGSRSIDTGSLWEYLEMLVLLIIGLNRLAVSVKQLQRHRKNEA